MIGVSGRGSDARAADSKETVKAGQIGTSVPAGPQTRRGPHGFDYRVAPCGASGKRAGAGGWVGHMLNVVAKVIFAIGALATLALLFYKFKHDKRMGFLVLGLISSLASVIGFVVNSIVTAQSNAPRAISVQERNRISAKMQAYAGEEYTGLIGSGVTDGWDLWREIGLSLDLAKWNFWCCVSRPIDQPYGHEASIWQAPIGNIHIFYTIPATPAMRGAADALANALSAEGLTLNPAVG
jgi:hypothetical protein